MVAKSSEPRTLIKIPVSLHRTIKDRAWERRITMMQYLESVICQDQPKDPRGEWFPVAAAAPITQPSTPGAPYDLVATEKTGYLSRPIADTDNQKPQGWISKATYDNLPPIFQESARDLVKKGRITIENMPGKPEGSRWMEVAAPAKGRQKYNWMRLIQLAK